MGKRKRHQKPKQPAQSRQRSTSNNKRKFFSRSSATEEQIWAVAEIVFGGKTYSNDR